MATFSSSDFASKRACANLSGSAGIIGVLFGAILAMLGLAGCGTPPSTSAEQAAQVGVSGNQTHEALSLKEGDVLKVAFPSVPGMDTTQPVRQDGRITLPIIGEFVAAGKTTDAISKELLELYSSQLVSREVNVTLVSSNYTLYVTGAVLRPGKIVTDRRLTVFDAIMEAGGFDKARADLKSVVVVRQEGGQSKSYTVDVKQVFNGAPSAPFYLKPFDSVYVPEKFSWF